MRRMFFLPLSLAILIIALMSWSIIKPYPLEVWIAEMVPVILVFLLILNAVQEGGDAGIAFLGSQGDIWNAQKDMLADTLGAITALLLFYWYRPDKKCE